MKTVKAQFHGNSTKYSYLVPEHDHPVPGDLIITSVSTQLVNDESDLNYNATVAEMRWARVVEVTEDDSKATKFYTWLIPVGELADRHKRNSHALKRVAERKAIMAKLDEMLLKEDRMVNYERLAQNNPRAAELLKQIKD